MESSPWKLIDKKFKAVEFVAATMEFAPKNFGTSLPDSPEDGQIFTLVDSLTAPTYIWTFRYNAASISYKWEFIGGLLAQVFSTDADAFLNTFTSTELKNGINDFVYYKSGNIFYLPYAGEYEFTGGVVVYSEIRGIRVSTQIIFNNFSQFSPSWPLVLETGFNYIPLPPKRLSGMNAGKIGFGIGSTKPFDTVIRWNTYVVRPIRIKDLLIIKETDE